jgi:hypothetical protein
VSGDRFCGWWVGRGPCGQPAPEWTIIAVRAPIPGHVGPPDTPVCEEHKAAAERTGRTVRRTA